MTVLIIAEPGSTWEADLTKGYRIIDAAKDCGADVIKFQWTSDAAKLAARRGTPEHAAKFKPFLELPYNWLENLKAHADQAGIEFMCSTYLIEDIARVAPLVKRFKVSAFESTWGDFIKAHIPWVFGSPPSHGIIVSCRAEQGPMGGTDSLYCVSKYPTLPEQLKLKNLWKYMDWDEEIGHTGGYAGLSDHTGHVLTGALAVAAGAQIIEAHIKLSSTPESNADYPHSHLADAAYKPMSKSPFAEYVSNVRLAERML